MGWCVRRHMLGRTSSLTSLYFHSTSRLFNIATNPLTCGSVVFGTVDINCSLGCIYFAHVITLRSIYWYHHNMDYLDRYTELRHRIILMVGYVLIAIGISAAAMILFYQAYGFGITRTGGVIQNGLVFFSSRPHPANVYIDGKLKPKQTNTRFALPADIYKVTLARDGYNDWKRTINLGGGSVQHFDYPFLIPKELVAKPYHAYQSAPGLLTQSPDRRWLMIEQSGSMTDFDVYDLKNPTKPATVVSLPSDLIAKSSAAENWLLGQWADDNQHVLLQHMYDGKVEFILLDRNDGGQSTNLTTSLSSTATKITLNNLKYDRYYLYDAVSKTLQTANLKDTAAVSRLQSVLSYKSYSDNTILYATPTGAPDGKVLIKIAVGDKTTTLRSFMAGGDYLLDLTKYSGTPYVVMGATNESKVYIYKDPLTQLSNQSKQAIAPIQVLHVEQPNYLSFSPNTQFIIAESGSRFGVYDIENKLGYNYTMRTSLDVPQVHAGWMDGNRLAYVSDGKLTINDYDNTNQQVLVTASAGYLPVFAPDYKFVYSLAPAPSSGQIELLQTSLLAPKDR